jgi:hypothetical protein
VCHNEWIYIGFHDDARIHANNRKRLIETPAFGGGYLEIA